MKKMKKMYFLILIIFLLTGCSAEYNIVYNNEILSETLNVTSLINNYNKENIKTLVNDYYNIPILVNYKLQPGDMEEYECESCDFYNKEIINNDINYGLKLNYSYKNMLEYSNSSVANMLFKNVIINNNYIKANNVSNIFDNFDNLEIITISFNTDKIIQSINSDEEKDGIYYWYINKDNYLNKFINIEFKENEIIKMNENGYFNGEIIKYILMVLVIIILISIIIIYEKVKKSNI